MTAQQHTRARARARVCVPGDSVCLNGQDDKTDNPGENITHDRI